MMKDHQLSGSYTDDRRNEEPLGERGWTAFGEGSLPCTRLSWDRGSPVRLLQKIPEAGEKTHRHNNVTPLSPKPRTWLGDE